MTQSSNTQDKALESANMQKRVDISRADLPLSCPMTNQKLWNAHPRVYLPIEESGEASCPYCGTHYVLTD